MSDPIAFVRARLDEREAAARRCAMVGDFHWVEPNDDDDPDGHVRDGRGRIVVWDEDANLSRHIALNDPQFVLDDVAAKRRIVDEFGDAGEWLPTNRDDDEPEYAYGRARALHDVIKLLAAPYASHPDFDPAWTVKA